MKINIICTLLFFLFIGIGTRMCAQTNAVLNYPMPAKKQVSTQKQNKQYTGTEVKRHTYNTIENNINTTDTIFHKKNTSEEKIKKEAEFIVLSTASKNSKAILHFYLDELGMQFWSARLFKRIGE